MNEWMKSIKKDMLLPARGNFHFLNFKPTIKKNKNMQNTISWQHNSFCVFTYLSVIFYLIQIVCWNWINIDRILIFNEVNDDELDQIFIGFSTFLQCWNTISIS